MLPATSKNYARRFAHDDDRSRRRSRPPPRGRRRRCVVLLLGLEGEYVFIKLFLYHIRREGIIHDRGRGRRIHGANRDVVGLRTSSDHHRFHIGFGTPLFKYGSRIRNWEWE